MGYGINDHEEIGVSPADRIPTYAESVEIAAYRPMAAEKRVFLTARLAEVQKSRVQEAIDKHIMPLVHEHIETGLSAASFALIHSDITLLEQSAVDTLLNFPDNHFTRVVRLKGAANEGRFWQQPRVLQQLERALRSQLGIQISTTTLEDRVSLAGRPSTPSSAVRWSFRRKQQDRTASDGAPPMFSQAKNGWRSPDAAASNTGSHLCVTNEEVCIRVSTDSGLYQTRTCPAVIIRLQLGS